MRELIIVLLTILVVVSYVENKSVRELLGEDNVTEVTKDAKDIVNDVIN